MAGCGSALWRSLRAYQVYGANTDVGKTVASTILCRALKNRSPGEKIWYLKPVSTGPDSQADDRYDGIPLLHVVPNAYPIVILEHTVVIVLETDGDRVQTCLLFCPRRFYPMSLPVLRLRQSTHCCSVHTHAGRTVGPVRLNGNSDRVP
jgi:hypothetical protein